MINNEIDTRIIRPTPSEVKTRLRDQIIGIRKTDSVKELAELYTAAHVFVNPTYEDNYPTTNLEALVRAVLAVPEPGHQRALYQCDERQRYQDYLSLYQQILYA